MEDSIRRTMDYQSQAGIALAGFHRINGDFVVRTALDVTDEPDVYETGYWVAPKYAGQGMATEAANAAIRYAFGHLGAKAISIGYFDGNEPSRRIVEKLGFEKLGVAHKAATRCLDGTKLDRHEYILTSPDALPELDVSWGQAIALDLQNGPVPIELRPALDHDFEYCRRLYFDGMGWIIDELHLDRTAQETGFRQQWNTAQVRIVLFDGTDVGWVQTVRADNELFVGQMFVESLFQRKGIGTQVMKRLISEATAFNLAVRVNVVRINPARRLYERLGFRVTHEDDRKFYMKRDADVV